MPRITVEMLKSPGVVRDTPAHKLPPEAVTDAKNIRFSESGAEALVGDLDIFSTASITPLWLNFFPPITAPIWVYGNLTEMWAVENTSHTEITRSASDYNAIVTERWQAAVLNGAAVFNNTVDVPQGWAAFDSSTLLVDLPNWAGTRRCKSIRAFKNFLVALNMTDSGVSRPYRVLWSDSAVPGTLPGSWDSTDPTTDSREFDLAETSDHLVDQLSLGDINVIYKEHSTWGMQYIGPPYYFRFWKILSKNGLLARDLVANVPHGHIVVGQDDIIVHSAQIEQSQSILDKTMRKWLFSVIDSTNYKNSFIVPHARRNELYFCYPEIGETYANQALVWNWRDNNIGVRDLVSTPFAAVGPIGESVAEDLEWGT